MNRSPTEWLLTDDGRWRPVDPVQEICTVIARVRALTEANRARIRRSRELIERLTRTRRMRRA